jgi:phospholipid transport system transporter-binding protein
MLECDETRCRLSGDVTVECAAELIAALNTHLAANVDTLDLSGVGEVDSTVLALILSCRRAAETQQRNLHLSGLPASVTTLAELYGVSDLLQA